METAASRQLREKFMRTTTRMSGAAIDSLIEALLADVESIPHLAA